MPVDVLPAARAEAGEARRRLQAARPGYGRRFNQAFLTSLRRIDDAPRLFPPVEDAPDGVEVRYVHLTRYNYLVMFAVFGETKLVVAVAYTAREPGYWHHRLP